MKTEQFLFEDGILIDSAPAGTWECGAEWIESNLKLNAFADTDWHYVGSSEDGNIKTYIISGDAHRYEMKTI